MENLKEEKLKYILYSLAFKDVQSCCIIYGPIHYPYCKHSIDNIRSFTNIPDDLYDCFLDDNNFLFKDIKYKSNNIDFGHKKHSILLGYVDYVDKTFYKI
jgi:hypothetical protein